MKLNVKAFAIACGLTWGIGVLLLGLINIFSSWGSEFQEMIATMYLGYKPTIIGSLIGFVWGILDAGIAGLFIAWLYNKLNK